MAQGKMKAAFVGGYSKRSVRQYLEELEGDYQRQLNELREQLDEIKAQNERVGAELNKYKENERYVSRAIIFAENFAREMEMQARAQFDVQVQKRREYLAVWRQSAQAQRDKLEEIERRINEMTGQYLGELQELRSGMLIDTDHALPPLDEDELVRMPARPPSAQAIMSRNEPESSAQTPYAPEPEKDADEAPAADGAQDMGLPPISDREELARICRELGLMTGE